MTESTIGLKYLKSPIEVDGGTIELIKEIKRPKEGKSSESELSSVKRVYLLSTIAVKPAALENLSKVTKDDNNKITHVTSNSEDTDLRVNQVADNVALISGLATYQALETLGLAKHVVKKE